jgi:hypothetical protein
LTTCAGRMEDNAASAGRSRSRGLDIRGSEENDIAEI